MTKIAFSDAIAGALIAFILSTAPAAALADRTWVSGKRADSGTCALEFPCNTFAFALTQTAAGGEIDVLDQADYGPVTITQSVSIVNDGPGIAAIGISSGNAITINAGVNDGVHLRGLTIAGTGGGINGILLNTGAILAVENCVVRGFERAGISISSTTSSSFSVSNTMAFNNRVAGIRVQPAASVTVTGVLSNITANNGETGIAVDGSQTTGGSLNVAIVDSEVSFNGAGVSAGIGFGPAAINVMVRNSVASNNFSFGLVAGTNAILRIAHSVVKENETGVSTSGGGILNSYGDNDIGGNTTDNIGVLIPIVPH
ncbi:MAG TPA: hypothetical protein VIF02_12555 [Methylocella sp.]